MKPAIQLALETNTAAVHYQNKNNTELNLPAFLSVYYIWFLQLGKTQKSEKM